MSARILATKPVGTYTKVTVDASSTITTSGWTVVSTAVSNGGSAVEIFNSTGCTLQVSQGTAGNETLAANLLPYTIPPGGSAFMLPMQIRAAAPLTVKSLDATSGDGILVMNVFG